MRNPLDPFSKVLNEEQRWDPEWYSWLQEQATAVTQLQSSITTLQSSIFALQNSVTTLQATSPPGLVFLSSQQASNSATMVFTGLTSVYAAYQFRVTAMACTVNNGALWMQMSVNGGATWKNTANNWTWLYSYIAGGAAAFGHSNVAEGSNAYFRIGGATNSTWGNNSEVMIYPNSGSNLNTATWRSIDYYDAGNGSYQVIGSGMEVNDATPCNAVRFFFSSGNMVSGRISMYGLRKT